MKIIQVRIKIYLAGFDQRYSFYKSTLNLEIYHEWLEPIGQRGAMFIIGDSILELIEDTKTVGRNQNTDLSLMVPNAEILWQELKHKVDVEFPIRDNSWGDISFCIADPGGFKITFFSIKSVS
jgi:hypothetical protein